MLFAGVDIAKVDHLIGTIDNKGKGRVPNLFQKYQRRFG